MLFRRLLLYLLISVLLLATVRAQQYEQIIANSADWHDVYSTIIFGKLQGIQTNFLVGQPHANILLFSIPKTRSVLIVSSSRNSYAVGYKSLFDAQGYPSVSELSLTNINLELAKRLPQTKNFIILDDSYGYNAISVAPYAIASNSYILFVDRRNINQIVDFLNTRNPTKVLLYGELDREARTRLAAFTPETINQGDRYMNNVEIVKKFRQIKGTQQVLFSNGEFLEDQLLGGVEPVLFIGTNNVPEAIASYIKSSDIKVGVLVGNELIGTATTIRRQLGISVFVKFAQSARLPGGSIANVEDLDRYPLPKFALNLAIHSVKYNELTRQLEITYKNLVDQGTYLKGTIIIRSNEGAQTIGDLEPIFIEGNEYRTIVYPFQEPLTGDIRAEIFTLFGESRRSFEYSLRQTVTVDKVSVKDDTLIEIVDLVYDKSRHEFIVTIKNVGTIDAYVNAEIVDLLVNGEATSYGSKEETLIPVGKSVKIRIPVDELTEADLADNPKVTLVAKYGARQNILTKQLRQEFDLTFKGIDYTIYVLAAVVIILLLLILTRKKCKKCGRMNNRFVKKCSRCGHEL
ncbi:MAG: hypothetical protein AABX51_08565 [Nanoarchaeota archaeon]